MGQIELSSVSVCFQASQRVRGKVTKIIMGWILLLLLLVDVFVVDEVDGRACGGQIRVE